jgi:hypothetical protein
LFRYLFDAFFFRLVVCVSYGIPSLQLFLKRRITPQCIDRKRSLLEVLQWEKPSRSLCCHIGWKNNILLILVAAMIRQLWIRTMPITENAKNERKQEPHSGGTWPHPGNGKMASVPVSGWASVIPTS